MKMSNLKPNQTYVLLLNCDRSCISKCGQELIENNLNLKYSINRYRKTAYSGNLIGDYIFIKSRVYKLSIMAIFVENKDGFDENAFNFCLLTTNSTSKEDVIVLIDNDNKQHKSKLKEFNERHQTKIKSYDCRKTT